MLHVVRSDPGTRVRSSINDAHGRGRLALGEVAFLRSGVLARAPLSGGPAKEVLKDIVAADWDAEGRDFAVVRYAGGPLPDRASGGT